MIKLCNVFKNYSKLSVFNGLSLEIKENEITCILGESGSGKTTLLNILANLTDYSGEVDKVKCSYVFQKPNLFPNLTVKQNLLLVNKNEEKIENISKKLKIYDKLNAYPKHLSGGQAQRAAFARGVLYDADLLLMDEPFSSLDLKVKIQMINDFAENLKENKKTVVFVTHDVEEAHMLANRAVILKNGVICGDFYCGEKLPREYGARSEFKQKILSAMLK